MAPVVLRDVNVFLKKHQVGQGTYGSVFVGEDKLSRQIVALKRINTEQEENGFPITAIREVKILKALNHPNIVTLKEIVTSKGAFLWRLLLNMFVQHVWRTFCFARCSTPSTRLRAVLPAKIDAGFYHGTFTFLICALV
jgi:hypothetical protein